MTPDQLREWNATRPFPHPNEAQEIIFEGHRCVVMDPECYEECFKQAESHAAALEEIERLKGELEESRRDLQFVERWANHHGVKPHIAAEEVLSVIQHYPPIRAITEGYADGKIPDTPNPWERAERLMVHAEAMAAADSCATYEDVANELRAAVMAYRAEFKGGMMDEFEKWSLTSTEALTLRGAWEAGREAGMREAAALCNERMESVVTVGVLGVREAILSAIGGGE